MGVNLSPLVGPYKKIIKFSDLRNKIIAIDAFNTIYQFLTTVRDPYGRPLRDSKGNVTSHLSGLFYRNIKLLKERVRFVYVFDGKPPVKKVRELERRKVIKSESYEKYLVALEKRDFKEARKYAAMAATLEETMIESSKILLELIGIPVIQAPSEGEAQASYMTMKGDVWAVGSQDYDSFLFGAPRIVRNITLTGRIKYPSRGIEVRMEPELILLDNVLNKLEITREQLIDMAILIGTDYNEGVRGIGPKKALELIKSYKSIEYIPNIKNKLEIEEIQEIRHLFLSPEVTDNYKIKFKKVDYDRVTHFLCVEHDFSEERVRKALNELKEATSIQSLDQWFK